MTTGHKPRGFTRADLIATLCALSLLSLLLLTTAGDTGAQTRSAGCLSNLRRLTQAWLLYAADNHDYFPPNVDDGGAPSWVAGQSDQPTADAVSGQLLVDPRYSLVGPYSRDPAVYRCPADPSTWRFGGKTTPRTRSVAANQAVGTKRDGFSPVDGPWLDGLHGHAANQRWYTFGKVSDVVHPAPSRLWLLIDEDESSINDGGFAVIMILPTQMIDWPATRHNVGATISFADGGAEVHHWNDPRTPVRNGNVNRVNQAGSADILWLQSRTTEPVISK